MPDELGAGNAFVEAQLTADSVLVTLLASPIQADFLDEPEPGVEAYPCLIFSLVSAGPDALAMGAERILAAPLYLVLAIGHGGYDELTPICSRADAALHQQQATVTVDGVDYDVTCYRETPVQPPSSSENGVRFVRRGAYYRLNVQAL